jgi:general secretion pathway protein G
MKRNKGFTLIELLVVLFIIAVLSGLLFPNFLSARQRARDSKRKGDLTEIRNALRLYYNDNQSYPATMPANFGENWDPYMQQIPADPLDTGDYVYSYTQVDSDSFYLEATLENEGDSDITDSALRCNLTPSPPKYFVCGN